MKTVIPSLGYPAIKTVILTQEGSPEPIQSATSEHLRISCYIPFSGRDPAAICSPVFCPQLRKCMENGNKNNKKQQLMKHYILTNPCTSTLSFKQRVQEQKNHDKNGNNLAK